MENSIKESRWLPDWLGRLLLGQNNRVRILVFGAAGLALLVFAGTDKAAEADTPAQQQVQTVTAAQYEQEIEQRLQQMIAKLAGAGEVSVMVTVETSAQTIYARQVSSSAEASDIQQRESRAEEYVLLEQSGEETALQQASAQPVVQGVAVVCEGAEDITLVCSITQLVSTVLGITSNRVYVTK